MNTINFFTEETEFKLEKPNQTKDWVLLIIDKEGYKAEEINYIFTSDQHLHKINLDYLNHDTYTDIITFDNSDDSNTIAADIFISIDRVKENAEILDTLFDEELHRVIIHGILHLTGYSDGSEEEKLSMRKKEEACLSLRR